MTKNHLMWTGLVSATILSTQQSEVKIICSQSYHIQRLTLCILLSTIAHYDNDETYRTITPTAMPPPMAGPSLLYCQ